MTYLLLVLLHPERSTSARSLGSMGSGNAPNGDPDEEVEEPELEGVERDGPHGP